MSDGKIEVTVETRETDFASAHRKIDSMLPRLKKFKKKGMEIISFHLRPSEESGKKNIVLDIVFRIPEELQNKTEEITKVIKGVAL